MNSTTKMMKKLVMRDFATCFTACTHLEEDEEEQRTNSSTSTDQSSKPMSHTPKGEKKRILHQKKNIKAIKKEDSKLPSFKEDDEFLDFCFNEDGAIEMVNEKRNNSKGSDHSTGHSDTHKWPRSNDKKKHGDIAKEDYEVDSGNKDQVESIMPCANEGETIPLHKLMMQIDERNSPDIEVDELPPDDDDEKIKEIHQIVESAESKTLVSGESSEDDDDSNHSDSTSSSSFAFPVLSWERMGSPDQMPKADGVRSHRHIHNKRRSSLPRHCCRF